jgi:hypothetical protein
MKLITVLPINKRLNICLFLSLMLAITPAHSTDKVDQVFSKFLSKCTAKTDYDPNKPEVTDDFTLAKGEREFLDCAYVGIEKNIIPESYIPNQYKDLIKSHRKWTNEVENKSLTRTERRSRTLTVIGILKNNDEQQKELFIQQMEQSREIMMEDMRRREMHRMMQPRINYSAMRGALR